MLSRRVLPAKGAPESLKESGTQIMNAHVRIWAAGILVTLTLFGPSPPPTEAGGTRTNQLANASSPYLREAAAHPVAWFPWGEEPFRLAKELDRPILMDIGAIWCHWCHVMDQETYSNPEVAKVINAAFIAIRVDRDERPDIDARYQQAVRALTGYGGWPLTVFLTPEGMVFHGGGTFFPDERFGQPGFRALLPKIAEVYAHRRESIVTAAERLRQVLAAQQAATLKKEALSPQLVGAIREAAVQSFDEVHGGFGAGAKFPHGSVIELALRLYAEQGDGQMLGIATKTLDAIATGGIHDHLGGGFHRYATDPAWRIPHFEKLTAVNAMLLTNYLHAYQATGKARYRAVAEGIIAYVNRVLADQERGGFYANQDADMGPGDDGGYYTWTVQEVRAAVSKEEAVVLIRYYDIDKEGEIPGIPSRNILWVASTPEQIARDLSLPVGHVEALIASGKSRLMEVRNKRKMPFVNRTLFADTNGMMISAYLEAYKVLRREALKAFALKSLDLLLARARSDKRGLYHAVSDGKPHTPGFLSDYVWVTEALLQAFQVTGDPGHLATARALMDEALRTFWDEAGGALFDFRPEPAGLGLLGRPSKAFEDSPLPSPNAMAALVLDQLGFLTNHQGYHQRAKQILEVFAGSAPKSGAFAASYALAADLHLHPPAHAVIIGRRSDPRTLALWQAALMSPRPGKIVAAYDPDLVKRADLPPPVAAAMQAAQAAGVPQAYICVGIACSLPTTEPDAVSALVRTFKRQVSSAN